MFRSYPWNSSYAFSENRVIDGIDLEGLEFSKVKTDKGWEIEVVFNIVNESKNSKITEGFMKTMIGQIEKDIKSFNGIDADGEIINFKATYSSSATINVYIVDSFSNAAIEHKDIFDEAEARADASGVALTPKSQVGDVLNGSVYLKSEHMTNTKVKEIKESNDNKESTQGLVKTSNAAFTTFHELLVHLISQNEDKTKDTHQQPKVGTKTQKLKSRQFGRTNQFYKLNSSDTSNNLFNPGKEVNFFLTKGQLKLIKDNIQKGLDKNEETKNIDTPDSNKAGKDG